MTSLTRDDRIYLLSPFTHENYDIQYRRYASALDATIKLKQRGLLVFSPIVYTYWPYVYGGFPPEFNFWSRLDLTFIRYWCTVGVVLQIDGWDVSRGIAAEVEELAELQLPCYYLTPYEIQKLKIK